MLGGEPDCLALAPMIAPYARCAAIELLSTKCPKRIAAAFSTCSQLESAWPTAMWMILSDATPFLLLVPRPQKLRSR